MQSFVIPEKQFRFHGIHDNSVIPIVFSEMNKKILKLKSLCSNRSKTVLKPKQCVTVVSGLYTNSRLKH